MESSLILNGKEYKSIRGLFHALLPRTDMQRNGKKVSITQYSPDLTLIKIHASTMEASRDTGVIQANITANLKKRKSSAGGSIWAYSDESMESLQERHASYLGARKASRKTGLEGTKKVVQLTKDTREYVSTFESVNEAERVTSISRGNISSTANNKKASAGGYKWMYEEEYNKLTAAID